MWIPFKTNATTQEPEPLVLKLESRLPPYISSPCTITCRYNVAAYADYYLLKLATTANLVILCQRCLHQYSYHYTNQVTLAICDKDTKADQLMEHYECLVTTHDQVNLMELLIDELHLYSPQAHHEITDCGEEVNRLIVARDD